MAGRIDPKSSSRKGEAFRTWLTIAVSIPVYLSLALLLYYWWPNLRLLALIPVCFAAHSTGYLISGWKE